MERLDRWQPIPLALAREQQRPRPGQRRPHPLVGQVGPMPEPLVPVQFAQQRLFGQRVLLHDPEWPRDELGGSQVADAERGHVRIVGKHGELAHWIGASGWDYLGSRVAVADDLDGDGHRDVWITAHANRSDPEVRSYSGATGTLIRNIRPTSWKVDDWSR